MPFYFVQLALYLPWRTRLPKSRKARSNPGFEYWNGGYHRHLQSERYPPKNKQDVGLRLALWALAKTYGKEDLVYSGASIKATK